ncbi:hypothetical protein ACFLWE_00400 [Chloroflexota bacterium]
MAKLKPKWRKTDIPKHVKVKHLYKALMESATFQEWTQVLARMSWDKEDEAYCKYSRDTYKALQDEIREMPITEIKTLPEDLRAWIYDVRGIEPENQVKEVQELSSSSISEVSLLEESQRDSKEGMATQETQQHLSEIRGLLERWKQGIPVENVKLFPYVLQHCPGVSQTYEAHKVVKDKHFDSMEDELVLGIKIVEELEQAIKDGELEDISIDPEEQRFLDPWLRKDVNADITAYIENYLLDMVKPAPPNRVKDELSQFVEKLSDKETAETYRRFRDRLLMDYQKEGSILMRIKEYAISEIKTDKALKDAIEICLLSNEHLKHKCDWCPVATEQLASAVPEYPDKARTHDEEIFKKYDAILNEEGFQEFIATLLHFSWPEEYGMQTDDFERTFTFESNRYVHPIIYSLHKELCEALPNIEEFIISHFVIKANQVKERYIREWEVKLKIEPREVVPILRDLDQKVYMNQPATCSGDSKLEKDAFQFFQLIKNTEKIYKAYRIAVRDILSL